MKNNHIYLLGLFALIVALAACTKPIEFNGDVTESQVVLQSKITAGDSIKVRLCWSRFFLDPSPFRMIDNATLQLSVDGTVVPVTATYSPSEALYTLGYIPQPGDSLSIVAFVPGHEPVSASTVVPANPRLNGATSTQTTPADYDSYIDAEYAVRFRLDDPEGEQNYYSISASATIDYVYVDYSASHITTSIVTQYDTTYTYNADSTDSTMVLIQHNIEVHDTLIVFDTTTENINVGFRCRDYLIIPQNAISLDEESYFNELYFTDANINGLSHEIQLTIPIDAYYMNHHDYEPYYGLYYDSYIPSSLRINLEVTSFSRDLYLYEQTTQQQTDELGGIISEPVQIHSNIDGGYGIFAARTSVVIPVGDSANPTDK